MIWLNICTWKHFVSHRLTYILSLNLLTQIYTVRHVASTSPDERVFLKLVSRGGLMFLARACSCGWALALSVLLLSTSISLKELFRRPPLSCLRTCMSAACYHHEPHLIQCDSVRFEFPWRNITIWMRPVVQKNRMWLISEDQFKTKTKGVNTIGLCMCFLACAGLCREEQLPVCLLTKTNKTALETVWAICYCSKGQNYSSYSMLPTQQAPQGKQALICFPLFEWIPPQEMPLAQAHRHSTAWLWNSSILNTENMTFITVFYF